MAPGFERTIEAAFYTLLHFQRQPKNPRKKNDKERKLPVITKRLKTIPDDQEEVMPFMFEKLEVYQKAVTFAERISSDSDIFPKGNYYLTDQLCRASLSIAANLAEGNGRWHKAERKQFFWIARGSAQECVPLMEIARRRKFIQEEEHKILLGHLEEINKMITGLIRGLDDAQYKAKPQSSATTAKA